jgi:hypothetical protein
MIRPDAIFARDFVDLAVHNKSQVGHIESPTTGHVAGEIVTLQARREAKGPQGLEGTTLGVSLQVQSEPA